MAGQQFNEPTESVNTLDGIAGLIDDVDTEAETEEEAGEAESEEQEGELPEEEQDEQPESDETFTVIHDGKEVTLTKAEATELTQKGLDYTKKTMALADERKALEPIKAKATETLQRHEEALNETLQRLSAVAEIAESTIGHAPTLESVGYDPTQYILAKEAYDTKVDSLRNTYGKLQHLEQQKNQLRQSQLLEQANETESYLIENLPGWKAAPEKSLQELNVYIQGFGLSPETTKDAYVQKGLWEIAYKAKMFDKLQEEKSKLPQKVATLPKAMKPSANNKPVNVRQQEAWKAYKAKPSLDSLANLLD